MVVTKNRYRDGLFNGTLGVVSAIDTDDRVQVLCEGETEARLPEQEAGLDVELAYAINCHRSQGSSARNVAVVLEDCALSTREWLYTAIRPWPFGVLSGIDSDREARTLSRQIRISSTAGRRGQRNTPPACPGRREAGVMRDRCGAR